MAKMLFSNATIFTVFALLILFSQGFANDAPGSINEKNSPTESHSRGTRTAVAIICFAVAAISLFLFFLYKLRQKKKREEQYARLVKLFEEDESLEAELSLRE